MNPDNLVLTVYETIDPLWSYLFEKIETVNEWDITNQDHLVLSN